MRRTTHTFDAPGGEPNDGHTYPAAATPTTEGSFWIDAGTDAIGEQVMLEFCQPENARRFARAILDATGGQRRQLDSARSR